MSHINRDFFYDTVRASLFGGRLSRAQVDGLNGLLDYWERFHGEKDPRWLAYALATAYHEVDKRMQPIEEYGGRSYFMRMYDRTGERPHVAERLGNIMEGDGDRYHGRGFVQLTGRTNYAHWTERLGRDLINQPEQALQLDVATEILFEGMIEGTFTGRKLSDYIVNVREDWRGARRIINGVDRATLIAGYAKKFDEGITYQADRAPFKCSA